MQKCQTLGITLEELNDAKRYIPFTFNDYVHMYPIYGVDNDISQSINRESESPRNILYRYLLADSVRALPIIRGLYLLSEKHCTAEYTGKYSLDDLKRMLKADDVLKNIRVMNSIFTITANVSATGREFDCFRRMVKDRTYAGMSDRDMTNLYREATHHIGYYTDLYGTFNAYLVHHTYGMRSESEKLFLSMLLWYALQGKVLRCNKPWTVSELCETYKNVENPEEYIQALFTVEAVEDKYALDFEVDSSAKELQRLMTNTMATK